MNRFLLAGLCAAWAAAPLAAWSGSDSDTVRAAPAPAASAPLGLSGPVADGSSSPNGPDTSGCVAPTAAISEFQARGMSRSDAEILVDRLRSELKSSRRSRVMSRPEMEAILQGEPSTCADAGCARDLGRRLDVQRMVSGSVDRIGDLSSFHLLVVDPATGAIAQDLSQDYSGSLGSLATQAVPDLARRLSAVAASGGSNGACGASDIASAPADAERLRRLTEEYRSTKRSLFVYAALGTGLFLGGDLILASACKEKTASGSAYRRMDDDFDWGSSSSSEGSDLDCENPQAAIGGIMMASAIPFAVLGTIKFVQTIVRGRALKHEEERQGSEGISLRPYLDPTRRATGIIASARF